MELSVVVPTLNGRDRLSGALDALAERAPDAEVVVVNGPSADGTSGMVRDRDDVDVLLEVSERNVNVARNAGARVAGGEAVAFLGDGYRVEDGWADAVRSALADGADAATGPVHRELAAGLATETEETDGVGGREVTFPDGGNVAFARRTLSAVDGFDEYLLTGGARDAAHRLAGAGRDVAWAPDMAVRGKAGDGGSAHREDLPRPGATGADVGTDWGWKYRSMAYRLAKNYGLRPGPVCRVVGQALGDATAGARAVLAGDESASRWVADGRTVLASTLAGAKDGLAARLRDRTPARNPNGQSSRTGRPVERYDWR